MFSSGKILILGYGPVGAVLYQQLIAQGRPCVVAQRTQPASIAGENFISCDVLNRDAVISATKGVATLVCTLGLPYASKIWQAQWPVAMANMLAACEATGARFVFLDNLYMYGPQTTPLTEDMPLTCYGRKPRVRAAITKQWQEAHMAGRVKAVAVRASDFFGAGIARSLLGETFFGALAKGKPALTLGSADLLHDVAYVPDVARALISLIDAADGCYGQAWHVPCAPVRSLRAHLAMGAKALGVAPKLMALPHIAMPLLGLFMPFVGELYEMRFQTNRDYLVSHEKFGAKFWRDATPFEDSIPRTALSFR